LQASVSYAVRDAPHYRQVVCMQVWQRFKEGCSIRLLHPQRWCDPLWKVQRPMASMIANRALLFLFFGWVDKL